ncbi:hypothetical protein EV192_1129 [Actinocrispum wychmicini]|uniref:Uncharacterized protein n=1 Tax=Actinocrispum wychmicini TaxID=1213861 RepID=A0A4R2J714_9PSEU|nr:hypothetical protein EV192_1129 [Actinocrispum wychmicini]
MNDNVAPGYRLVADRTTGHMVPETVPVERSQFYSADGQKETDLH